MTCQQEPSSSKTAADLDDSAGLVSPAWPSPVLTLRRQPTESRTRRLPSQLFRGSRLQEQEGVPRLSGLAHHNMPDVFSHDKCTWFSTAETVDAQHGTTHHGGRLPSSYRRRKAEQQQTRTKAVDKEMERQGQLLRCHSTLSTAAPKSNTHTRDGT